MLVLILSGFLISCFRNYCFSFVRYCSFKLVVKNKQRTKANINEQRKSCLHELDFIFSFSLVRVCSFELVVERINSEQKQTRANNGKVVCMSWIFSLSFFFS